MKGDKKQKIFDVIINSFITFLNDDLDNKNNYMFTRKDSFKQKDCKGSL